MTSKKKNKQIGSLIIFILSISVILAGCGKQNNLQDSVVLSLTESEQDDFKRHAEKENSLTVDDVSSKDVGDDSPNELSAEGETKQTMNSIQTIEWDPAWTYADRSEIHSDSVTLYQTQEDNRRNITIAVNAGHGTSGGESVQTPCHPDGTPKVTGGSTSKGSLTAMAVAGGTTLLDGTSEADATLSLAKCFKEELLAAGYDVLMIRESEDAQLDNIARTVFANNNAQGHISLHYDSTADDKGAFYIGVPDISSYRSMEPVASYWQYHNELGEALISGLEQNDINVYGDGNVPLDLTQTSYSTIPSIDIEVGDRASDHSEEMQRKIAKALVDGVNMLYGE